MSSSLSGLQPSSLLAEIFIKNSLAHVPLMANIDREKLELIGLITVRFQRLEFTILQAIQRVYLLRGTQKLSQILSDQKTYSQKTSMLVLLLDISSVDRREELLLVAQEAKKMGSVRNMIQHSTWTASANFKLKQISDSGTHKYQWNYTTIDELRKIVKEIEMIDTLIDGLTLQLIPTKQ